MRFHMTNAMALAILSFANGAVARDYIQVDGTATTEQQLVLTTILDGAPIPAPTGGDHGIIVVDKETCRALTTTVCEIVQVTSVITTTSIDTVVTSEMTTPIVTQSATSGVSTTQVSTSTSQAISSSTSQAVSSEHSSIVTTGGTPTPTATSGAHKSDTEAVGLLAGMALFLII